MISNFGILKLLLFRYKKVFNVIFAFLFFCLALGVAFKSFATNCYNVSGASGSPGYTGIYTDTGTTNDGEPVYSLDAGHYLFKWQNGATTYSNLYSSVVPDNTGSTAYYLTPYPGSADLSGTYTSNLYGGSDAVVASTTCPGGGGATTTDFSAYGLWGTVATSTWALVSNTALPFWEIALGFLIAFFALFFIAIGLSRAFKWLLKK